jgi:ribosomal protein L15
MTSERTLRKWRKEALESINLIRSYPKEGMTHEIISWEIANLRLLDLTQELMDLSLMKENK